MATDETQTVHPGDVIQSIKNDWSRGHFFLVEQTRSWGVEAVMNLPPREGFTEGTAVYNRFKPGDFAVIGGAHLISVEVLQARKDSLRTAAEVERERGK